VLQLERASRLLLADLARRAPLLPGGDTVAFLDIDSVQKRVYGHQKKDAAFGHTKIQGKSLLVRGLNALGRNDQYAAGGAGDRRHRAARRQRGLRPRYRRGRDAGGAGGLGAASAAFTGAVRAAGAFFSVSVRMDPRVKGVIAAIPETAWTPIRYPRAIWDDQLRRWVSDAEIAETEYTAFASRKGQAITARLIVRRVKDLNRTATAGQGELFPA